MSGGNRKREATLTPDEEATIWLEDLSTDPAVVRTALGGLVRSRVQEHDGLTIRDCQFLKAVAHNLSGGGIEDLETLKLCGSLVAAVEVSLATGIAGPELITEVKGALDLPKAE